jgi:hypothetical protein
MSPLSPFTYYLRHKRQTLLLVGLVSLMTLGVCVMVRLLGSLPENYQTAGNYLAHVSLVSAQDPALDSGVVAQIRAHPGVAGVIQEKGLNISLPPIISEHHLFGVSETDMQALMDACDLRLVEALTFEWMQKNYQLMALILLAIFVVVEIIIAVVAAVALAALSYTFFSQRQEEFGVLHAIGRSRPWLVLRTVRETASAIGVAWLLSALLCGVGLVGMQFGLYAPRGLSLNFLNPVPWLFTLPIPLAVVAASGGLVARMLRRLDPVSIIERRL